MMLASIVNITSGVHSISLQSPCSDAIRTSFSNSVSCARFLLQRPAVANLGVRSLACLSDSRKSDANSDTYPKQNPKLKPKGKTRVPQDEGENSSKKFPPLIPKKPRRGRRSETAAVEDFVRDSLGRTFESIRQQNPDILKDMENIMKEKGDKNFDDISDDDDGEDSDEDEGEKKMLLEEEDPNWPLDADVGWGIRASEYFDQHPIKNVVGEDGR